MSNKMNSNDFKITEEKITHDEEDSQSMTKTSQIDQLEEHPTKINFFMLDQLILSIYMIEYDCLWELKETLYDEPLVALFRNFDFSYKNTVLDLYSPLAEFYEQLSENEKKEKELRFELVPGQLNSLDAFKSLLSFAQFIQNDKKYLSTQTLKFFESIGKTDLINQSLSNINLECSEINLDKLLNEDLSYSSINTKVTQENDLTKVVLSDKSSDELGVLKYLAKIQIESSSQDELMTKEDFIEITVETLEKKILGIVLNKNGVYLNRIETIQGEVDNNYLAINPNRKKKRLSGYFPNFISLLCHESPMFASEFNIFLNSIYNSIHEASMNSISYIEILLNSDVNDITNDYKHWVKVYSKSQDKHSNQEYYVYQQSINTFIDSVNNSLKSIDNRSLKLWNEEFIACNVTLNNEKNLLGKINKVKLCRKTQQKFVDNCVGLVKAVTNKEMIPMNIGMNDPEDYYLQNNTLISIAQNNSDHWRIPVKEYEMTTYSAANADLRNLKEVLKLGIPNLNFINTVLIDRLGKRYVLQNLLDGMLHFNPKKWGRYGTFDEGATFYQDPKFDSKMKLICNNLWLTKDNLFKSIPSKTETNNESISNNEGNLGIDDEDDNINTQCEPQTEINLHGSPEVKGVVAGDGRKYLMELMRLSPRDLNFEDKVEHSSCLIRPKLLKNYQISKCFEEMYKKKLEDKKNQESENDQTDEKEKKIEINPLDLKSDDIKQLYLNSSLYTTIESSNENVEDEIKDLKKVSDFLLKDIIPSVVTELTDMYNSNPVIDCQNLIDIMHRNGINTRYLGIMHQICLKTTNKYVERLIEFCIIMRSFVKMTRDQIKKYKNDNPLKIILQCLNIFLSDDDMRLRLQNRFLNKNGTPSSDSPTKTKENPTQNNLNKKKKKKKSKKKKIEIIEQTPELFKGKWFQNYNYSSNSEEKLKESYKSINISEIHSSLQNIAEKKFSFKQKLNFKLLDESIEKIRFLREVLLKMSLKLNNTNINFSLSSSNSNTFRVPLKIEDISEIGVKIKSIDYTLEEIKLNLMSVDRDLKKKEFSKALMSLKTYLPVALNIYGHFNNDVILTLNKIGICYAYMKDIKTGLSHQILAYILSLKLNGPHNNHSIYILKCIVNYLYELGEMDNCINMHMYYLKCLDVLGGRYNPLSIECLTQLYSLANQTKNLDLCETVLLQLENRTSCLYGKGDQKNLNWLSRLAFTKSQKGDFKAAKELQSKNSFILRQIIKKQVTAENEAAEKETKEPVDETKVKTMSYWQYYRLNLHKKFEESEKMKNYFDSKLKEKKN